MSTQSRDSVIHSLADSLSRIYCALDSRMGAVSMTGKVIALRELMF